MIDVVIYAILSLRVWKTPHLSNRNISLDGHQFLTFFTESALRPLPGLRLSALRPLSGVRLSVLFGLCRVVFFFGVLSAGVVRPDGALVLPPSCRGVFEGRVIFFLEETFLGSIMITVCAAAPSGLLLSKLLDDEPQGFFRLDGSEDEDADCRWWSRLSLLLLDFDDFFLSPVHAQSSTPRISASSSGIAITPIIIIFSSCPA